MPFDQYVAAIQTCAEVEGATQRGVPYCEPEAWRDSYNDGMTPKEAWHEEMLAAAEMLGCPSNSDPDVLSLVACLSGVRAQE